jgi:hypothetical protein
MQLPFDKLISQYPINLKDDESSHTSLSSLRSLRKEEDDDDMMDNDMTQRNPIHMFNIVFWPLNESSQQKSGLFFRCPAVLAYTIDRQILL